ncbi:hypothetical protein [Cellulomonas shaoxiangyii]|uniref:Uncharacterized protein n=1 Tax=Cellulomonas shaoxiangyii TaxID=2566013 RepID=A0A4P7SE03_9CELL|nr:hypothetical protein [Cellulomonas shaoxiangyii]QCB92232.1 hypothetical protein E5225_00345 [Cellulomonas shaoxiangyii]TGY79260.1 hypothetical protein E5226_15570 [Cellulomonas shaoxiangyii]
MSPERHLLAVRRAVRAAVVVAGALALVTLVVGGSIAGLVLVTAGGAAVGAAVSWILTVSAERRAAELHAAQGMSWRPGNDTTR